MFTAYFQWGLNLPELEETASKSFEKIQSHTAPIAKHAIYSVQFSRSVMSNSLWPHGLHLARRPCPSPTPRVHPNSCPLSRWCHSTISSSVVPFSSCLQFFPVSGSFQMSHFFESGGQSIGISASTSVLPMNIQDYFPLGLTGLIYLLLQHHSSKASIFQCSAFFIVQLSHPYIPFTKHCVITATIHLSGPSLLVSFGF